MGNFVTGFFANLSKKGGFESVGFLPKKQPQHIHLVASFDAYFRQKSMRTRPPYGAISAYQIMKLKD